MPIDGTLQLQVRAEAAEAQPRFIKLSVVQKIHMLLGDGVLLEGERSPTLTLNSSSSPLSSRLFYYVVISIESDTSGYSTQSQIAEVQFLTNRIDITQQPQGGGIPLGGNLELSAIATNPANRTLSYQWYRNNILLEGETRRTLTLTSSSYSGSTAYYSLKVSTDTSNFLFSHEVSVRFLGHQIHITQQPQGGDVSVDSSLQLSVEASIPSSLELSYQWYRNNNPLEGKTGRVLILDSSSYSSTHALYHVKVFPSGNPQVGLNSSKAKVRFLDNQIHITQQPQGGNVPVDGPLQLHITASTRSNIDLSYQWYRGMTLLNGETRKTLTLDSSSSPYFRTSYYVKVFPTGNPSAALSSSQAIVRFFNNIHQIIIITRQPLGGTVRLDRPLLLSIEASVSNDYQFSLSYQWYKSSPFAEDVLLNGETGNSLELTPSSHMDSYTTYRVKVYIPQVASRPFWSDKVAVQFPSHLEITQQPTGGEVPLTGSLQLRVATRGANPSQPLSYQWYKSPSLDENGSPLEGETRETLTLTSASAFDPSAIYYVKISNGPSDFFLLSHKVEVRYLAHQITITQQPQTGQIPREGSLELNVTATLPSQVELGYQWYRNGLPLEGETRSTLTLNSSSYLRYTAIYYANIFVTTNPSNSIKSREVDIRFPIPQIEITREPQEVVTIGALDSEAVLSVETFLYRSDEDQLNYQWYKSSSPNTRGVLLEGETSSTLRLTGTSHNGPIAFYYVEISIASDPSLPPVQSRMTSVDFNPYAITCTITSGYQNKIYADRPQRLNLSCASNDPSLFSYQWYRDDTLLEGKTNPYLLVTSNLSSRFKAVYSAEISTSPTNSQRSSEFELYFPGNQVQFAQQPQEGEVPENGSLQLRAEAFTISGLEVGYQWYRDGVPIDGSNEKTLTLTHSSTDKYKHEYYVVAYLRGTSVYDPYDSIPSSVVNVDFPANRIRITQQPQEGIVSTYGSLQLRVKAHIPSDFQLLYQWYRDGHLIEGATQSTLILTSSSTLQDSHTYYVKVYLEEDPTNYIYSSDTFVTFQDNKLQITQQPEEGRVTYGRPYELRVEAGIPSAPEETLNYQWYKNGSLLSDATGPTLQLNFASHTNSDFASYYVLVSSPLRGLSVSSNNVEVVFSPLSLEIEDQFVLKGGEFSHTIQEASTINGQNYTLQLTDDNNSGVSYSDATKTFRGNVPNRLGNYVLQGTLSDGTQSKKWSFRIFVTKEIKPLLSKISTSIHTCATHSIQRTYCWGAGSKGQLGHGPADYPEKLLRPATVGEERSHPIYNLIHVDTGLQHTCALESSPNYPSGEVYARCWGDNSYGQLGDDEEQIQKRSSPTQVLHGEIHPGGPIAPRGKPLTPLAQISTGYSHTCALTSEGTVKCWGRGLEGQLGHGAKISSHYPVFVVEKHNRSNPLRGIVQISAGYQHTCALTLIGTVQCWGNDQNGQLGRGRKKSTDYPVLVKNGRNSQNPLRDVVQISAGYQHTCALTSGGNVKCWGSSLDGLLGQALSRPSVPYPVDVLTGANQSPMEGVLQISTGQAHNCAILGSNRKVQCWGRGAEGQLGRGENSSSSMPYPEDVITEQGETEPLSGVIEIDVGLLHSCALTSQGEVKCWGMGGFGRLGNGSEENRPYPVSVVDEPEEEASSSSPPRGSSL